MENFYRPEDAFITILNTFKFFGVWPASVKKPKLKFIYQIYGYGFQLFYIIAALPPQLINIYLTRNDLQKMMDSCFFTLTCIVYATKLGIFFLHRTKIENFFERLHHPIFAPRRKENLSVLKKCTIIAKVSALIFLITPQVTCIFWIMIPLVDSNQKKELLFAAWYPFDTSRNLAFKITYTFQAILLLNTAAMNGMLDVLVTNFYVFLVGQTEILKQNFKLLADTTSVRNYLSDSHYTFLKKTVKNDKILYLYQEEHFSKKTLHERILNCTKHYEAIITFVEDIRDLFQIGIVAQVCASCIVICVTCFELTLIPPNTLQFYVMVQYQICMLIEIFFYTWRGNEITVKTSELHDAIYECDWTSISDKKFRQSLCIIMSRLQTPVKILVGNFFVLSIDTFFSILRSAYSFYVLLKQVQAKKE